MYEVNLRVRYEESTCPAGSMVSAAVDDPEPISRLRKEV
jgi:hypothetical protein